jgi:hypothetical protein
LCGNLLPGTHSLAFLPPWCSGLLCEPQVAALFGTNRCLPPPDPPCRAPLYDVNNTVHPPQAERLVELAQLQPGEAVLDVGTGTGLVALLAAERAGGEGSVTGVDLSDAMVHQASGVDPVLPCCLIPAFVAGPGLAGASWRTRSRNGTYPAGRNCQLAAVHAGSG